MQLTQFSSPKWEARVITHLSLFSGIGGIDLAAEWAGFKTVAFVEQDPFCQKVLAKHWPEVPIYGDIRQFDGTAYRGVHLISGGFPCQPFSTAGNRRGKEDDRFLWPEMRRVVDEARPAWVLGENVDGFVNLGLDQCLAELGDIGYDATAFVFPAGAVGAPHIRYRCFIVARNADDNRKPDGPVNDEAQGLQGVGDTEGTGFTGGIMGSGQAESWRRNTRCRTESWDEATESGLDRVADGVPDRVDRIRALGNAVVPQQVYPILKAIAEAA